jgi:phosphoglycolate phosphatase
MMPVKAILFDKDGTLFDFKATYGPATASVIVSLAGEDQRLREDMAMRAGFDLPRQEFDRDSVVIAGTAADLAEIWGGLLGRADAAQLAGEIDRMYEHLTMAHLAAFPFTAGVLAALLAQGYPLGLATNDAEAGGRAHLEAAGFDKCFEFVCGYDSGHGAKPGPGMVAAFAEHCRIEPSKVLMVGDSPHDMLAGRAAGVQTAAVLSGLAQEAVLRDLADHVIDDLRDLPELVSRLNTLTG